TTDQERMLAPLRSGFEALALIIAFVGLYRLLTYSVTRRTKEMGIRLALGAHRGRVIGMVIRSAVRLLTFGVALGLPAAWAASRMIDSMLFGLPPSDPAAVIAAVSLLTAAALLAADFPARRASRVDSTQAL